MDTELILNGCGVDFVAQSHEYYLGGKQLQGITGSIVDWLFPNDYANIPQYVLDRAKEHGSYVHGCIELSDIVGATPDCPESQQYLDMMKANGLRCLSHEYLVTDGENFASAIDLVLHSDAMGIVLGDIKTTSKLHKAKVRAQLSIYAHWFERINPHLKVARLAAIWLPKPQYGEPTWVDIERTDSEKVEATIQAYLRGESNENYVGYYDDYENPSQVTADTLPANYNEIVNAIATLEMQVKTLQAQEAEMRATLLDAFRQHGVKKIDNEAMTITYIAPSTRASVDAKKLKAEHPDVYASCLKESTTKDTIKITLK